MRDELSFKRNCIYIITKVINWRQSLTDPRKYLNSNMTSSEDVPRKLFIKDLPNYTDNCVWVQGTIEQTVGTDILIITDGTGKAKVAKCDSASGTLCRMWITKGSYCCVIGKLARTKGIPEITASKLINLTTQPALITSWEYEVLELQNLLENKIVPII